MNISGGLKNNNYIATYITAYVMHDYMNPRMGVTNMDIRRCF